MSAPEPPAETLPIRFGPDGLVPAVVQDATTGDVLMVAFMNREALAATRATNRSHFWSRSRGKLWRKGETSGHEQIVEGIYVNCEQDSLLLKVRQVGAACHDGYPTCYYRRLEPDDSLTVVRDRAFDPSDVYRSQDEHRATAGTASSAADELERATRLLYGAFAYLRDNDLAAASGTSRRLRSADPALAPRVADELGELAGVLDGSHRHAGSAADLLLEGSQVLYWVLLAALRDGISWERLRPDLALAAGDEAAPPSLVADALRTDADRWASRDAADTDLAARCRATLELVAGAARAGGLDPRRLVAHELASLRAKPYLAPFFAADAAADPPVL